MTKPRKKTAPTYSMPYRTHHVCVDCRKDFKKLPAETPHPCPECGAPLADCGRKFHTPKSSDDEQWKKLRLLIENGFHFQPVWIQVDENTRRAVPYPETLAEARDFVEKYRDQARKPES